MASTDDNGDHCLTWVNETVHSPNRPPSSELLRMRDSRQGWMIALLALVAGLAPAVLQAEEPLPFSRVEPLFRTHCYSCHGIEKPKGELRIDKLDPDLVKGSD